VRALHLTQSQAMGVVAVTASGNPENIKQLALAQTLPDLTPAEVEEITAAGKTIHFRHYVCVHLPRRRIPSPHLIPVGTHGKGLPDAEPAVSIKITAMIQMYKQ
jgi:hypothetical protein